MRFGRDRAVRRSRAAFIAGALVLLLAQTFSAVHFAKYGNHPHEHFGKPCVIAMASDHGQKFIPATSAAVIAVVFAWVSISFAAMPAPQAARVVVQRSRGPPSATSIR